MAGLSYKDKMKVSYSLYKKGNKGAVAKSGGTKLSEGCILVPSNTAKEIIDGLTGFKVKARKLEIYASEEHLKASLRKHHHHDLLEAIKGSQRLPFAIFST